MLKKTLKKAMAFTLAGVMMFSGSAIINPSKDAKAATDLGNINITAAPGTKTFQGVANTGTKFVLLNGSTGTFDVATSNAASSTDGDVSAAPVGLNKSLSTVTVENSAKKSATVTLTASGAISSDITADSQFAVRMGDTDIPIYLSTSKFAITPKAKNDTVALATVDTTFDDLMKAAGVYVTATDKNVNTGADVLANFNQKYTYDIDSSIRDQVVVKSAAGVTLDESKGLPFDATIAFKDAAAAGITGAITVNVPVPTGGDDVFTKGAVNFTIQKRKPFGFTANVKTAGVVSTANDVHDAEIAIKTNTASGNAIPFKSVITMSTGVTAAEVTKTGAAMDQGKNNVIIKDQTITFKKEYTTLSDGTERYIKFAPSDSSVYGNPITLKITVADGGNATSATSYKMDGDVAVASLVNSTTGDFTAGTKAITATKGTDAALDDDTWNIYMKDDSADGIADVATGVLYDGTNTATITYKAKRGALAGTYDAFVVSSKDGLTFNAHPIKVVVSGKSKDDVADTLIWKVDGVETQDTTNPGTFLATKGVAGQPGAGAQNVEIASNKTSKINIQTSTSGAKAVNEKSTGAKITYMQVVDKTAGNTEISGAVTYEGLEVSVDATKLTVGHTYELRVKTGATNNDDSDVALDNTTANNGLKFKVVQGYTFKYNLGNGKIKSGKTLDDVTVIDGTSAVKLEDGNKIEYVGADFLGWSYTSGATKADISPTEVNFDADAIKKAIEKRTGTDINLYAVWQERSYTVTYDKGAGTTTTAAPKKTFKVSDVDVTLPSDGYVNGASPLVSWSVTSTGKTAAGGAALTYDAGATLNLEQLQAIVSALDESAKTVNITLYAQYGSALTSVELTPATLSMVIGDTETLTAKALNEAKKEATGAVITFTSSNPLVASVDAVSGVVTAIGEGTANITATAKLGTVEVSTLTPTVVTVTKKAKKANTLTVKGKTAKVKYGKKATLKVSKVLTIKKAKGKKTFVKKSGKTQITISKKTGKVTVKKGLKKGTYKVKVAVTAAGNDSYKAKTVIKTFKIKVK